MIHILMNYWYQAHIRFEGMIEFKDDEAGAKDSYHFIRAEKRITAG